MTNKYSFMHLVSYKDFHLWDVKRYYFEGHKFDKSVRLGEVLFPYDKSVTNNLLLENSWPIISKINFSGILFLRELAEIKTFKGKLHLIDGDTLIYSKINVRHGCVYFHESSETPFAVSSEYPAYKLDSNRVYGPFLVKVLQSSYFKKALSMQTTGISKARVKPNDFLGIQIPLPSLEEQKALVSAYQMNLDKAMCLDVSVSTKDKEFMYYIEDRLGVIKASEILPSNGTLSFAQYRFISQWGVDFIKKGTADVQSSAYECRKISDICSISSGGTPSRGRKDYYGGNIPWVKTGELRNEILLDTEEKITQLGLDNSSAKLYPAGAIAIAMYGATIGKTAKLGIEAATNQACAVLTQIANDKILTDYLWIYLQSQADKLKSLAYGGAQPNINAGIIANYRIPLPPLSVQQEIVDEVQKRRAQIASCREQAAKLRQDAIVQFEQAIFE